MQDIRNPDTPPNQRAALAGALDKILERKRIMRMKPAPKPIDVYSKPRRENSVCLPLPSPQTLEPSDQSPDSAAQ